MPFNITVNEETLDMSQQITSFADQMPHWKYEVDSPMESTYGICDNSDDDLGNFFARPIKTQTYTWSPTGTLFEKFNPWNDFFNNPRVINRISNFMNLRCKLHVKFILNGNGFHYGRALASYIPLHNIDNVTQDRAFFVQDIVAASQRPKIFLDPTKSKGGDLVLPFFWYNNNLSIPDTEWSEMGDIIIHEINALKHANGASDAVNISVFVWAEDVVLSIPTSAEPGSLAPQSGDEYGDGVISRPMGILSRVAGSLVSAPVIGLYARAAQMGASAVSNVAQLFGYSRPNVVEDIVPYRPVYMGNMVNTMYPDTATKLTLDPKQELTVDPRTMGLGSDDEMTVKSIAMRESYYIQFPWATSNVTEDLLFTTKVTPIVFDTLSNNGNTELHFPACCFATLPFAKWRGTMKFRFQIVASAYHKGRIKIVYEPYQVASNEYNTNFTHIVDLAKQRDFSVDIGWGQPRSFCDTQPSNLGTQLPYLRDGTTFGTPSTVNNQINGYLSVYVVNELTTPNSDINNDISVNVYTSMCDDFEVAEPTSLGINLLSVFAEPQSGFEFQSGTESRDSQDLTQPDGDRNLDEDKPQGLPVQHTLAPKLEPTDHTMDVFYGDPITSFRQLLKRYNYYGTYGPSSADLQVFSLTLPNFPSYRGYDPDGAYNAATPVDPTPYNYFNTTLLNYISVAFGARRGGLRWKMAALSPRDRSTQMSVTRNPSGTGTINVFEENVILDISNSNNNQRASQFQDFIPVGMDGLHTTTTKNNPVLEYELPFYDTVRFYPAKRVTDIEVTELYATHEVDLITESLGIEYTAVPAYVATGEDFMLAFYLGPPIFYLYVDPDPSTTVAT